MLVASDKWNLDRTLIILFIVLILINGVSFFPFDQYSIRVTRIISSFLVLVFSILFMRRQNIWIWLFFIFQAVSSIGYFFYDDLKGASVFLICSVLIYLIISIRVLFRIKLKSIGILETIIYSIIFIANILFHTYNVGNFKNEITHTSTLILVYVLGYLGMATCLIVGFYNATRINTNSSFYIYATFAFVFADFGSMMAYYYGFYPPQFYFIERICYISGLCIFLKYALNYSSAKLNGSSKTIIS